MLNLTVQASVLQTECLNNQQNNQTKLQGDYPQLLYWENKQERQKRKDQPWRRLATINKIAQKAGYNLPTYQEKRTIAELLKQHGEYAYLTGKHLGNYYLSTLDIDIKKEEFAGKLIERLDKNTACLLDYLQVSYDKTKKGLHVDILTPEPLDNEIIYRIDKLGKKWTIGSIQSLGKYVVGEDKHKAYTKNGKWYWITKSNEEVKAILNKFFFILGNQEKKPTENRQLLETENSKTVRYQAWDYNLNKAVMREYSLIAEKPYKKPKETKQQEPFNTPTTQQKKYTTIRAKILSSRGTNLENMWKIFYLDQQGHRGYFLLNDYHRKNINLGIGTTRSILLVNGHRHSFFSRLI